MKSIHHLSPLRISMLSKKKKSLVLVQTDHLLGKTIPGGLAQASLKCKQMSIINV